MGYIVGGSCYCVFISYNAIGYFHYTSYHRVAVALVNRCGVVKIKALGAYYGDQYSTIDHLGRVAVGVVVDGGQTTGKDGASYLTYGTGLVGYLYRRSIGGAIDATQTMVRCYVTWDL